MPDTLTRWPGSNCSTVRTSPIWYSVSGSRNSASVRSGPASAFLRWPSSALVSLCSGASPKALRIADARDRARPRLDHRHRHARAVLGEHLSHPDFLADERSHRRSGFDLDVDPGRERVQALEGVDRLRGRLVDVDQPLVGADLEVLARVLVLERRADHAVDVLV